MGKILGAGISPHPPIILPEIGRGREGEVQETIDGLKKLAKKIRDKKPDTLLFITPHGEAFQDAHSVLMEEELQGDFSSFGEGDLKIEAENDIFLGELILENAIANRVPLIPIGERKPSHQFTGKLDWGVLVPLYYIQKEYTCPILSISYGYLDSGEMERLGETIYESIQESDRRVFIVASGDLSHALKDSGPYAYDEKGPAFDKEIRALFEKEDFKGILNFDKEISIPAKECGLRTFQILAGAIQNLKTKTEIYSYQGNFGVGYMTGFVDIEG